MSSSDVENFNGKIVYNLDGSALIIDAGNATVPSINRSSSAGHTGHTTAASATQQQQQQQQQSTSRGRVTEKFEDRAHSEGGGDGSGSGSVSGSILGGCQQLSPKIHSFRVVSAQDASTHCQDPRNAIQSHKHKPILMCFICKLSFGTVNSFSLHANSEHRLNLLELEQQLLNREYSSAIIQRNMDEKPQISFLQPLDVNAVEPVDLASIDTNQTIAALNQLSAVDASIEDRLSECDGDGAAAGAGAEAEAEAEAKADGAAEAEIATKSTVKFGSLNSATIKTNNNPTLSTTSSSLISCNSPASASTPIQSPAPKDAEVVESRDEVGRSPPADSMKASTDNIGSDKSNKRSQRSEVTGNVTTSPIVSGSDSTPPPQQPHPNPHPHPNPNQMDTDATLTAADILQQHLLSLQQQQQQQVTGSAGVFPPMQAQLSSFHASLAALANEQNARGVKLLTEFLQQQLHQQQQQQQQQKQLLFPASCLEHPDFKGVDCKTCELIDIQHRTRSPATPQSLSQSQSQSQPPRSPNGSSSGGLSTSMPISPSASSSVGNVGNATAASSFTIGACSDHINGRPQGVDCARCEMLLSSARLNSGVQMSTRNSCKTLKCPQCNWHYKYQETLEIHMREKHPDGESACGYCLAGQQHPRLARGESYSCGYKPYRCEICNYSTTTKGNLSIHMQSDKHLNNMQELNSSQNMVAVAAAAAASAKLLLPSPSPQGAGSGPGPVTSVGMGSGVGVGVPQQATSSPSCSSGVGGVIVSSAANSGMGSSTVSSASIKPKPSFRCDICSYETSVARNLRIHMTSEKHTHNMAVLQNNIKHIQAFNFLQQQQQGSPGVGASGTSGFIPVPVPEVALADLAYNQALMIQLLQQNAQQQQLQQLNPTSSVNSKMMSPTSSSPVSTPDQMHASSFASYSPKPLKMPQGLNLAMGMAMETCSTSGGGETTLDASSLYPDSLPELWPTALYSCLICDCFSTNDMDELNQHLLLDRSRQSSSASADIMVIHNNNYICRLCNYKTNLKANFQLHSKTDKHLQKLNFINHIREGGARNEYKLQYQPQLATNVVQLRCNCCDFHTNSIQKLSLHTQQMRHDTMRMIFQHLLIIIQKSRMRKSSLIHSDRERERERESPMMHDGDQEQQQPKKALCCHLCNFVAKNLHDMVQHVKGLRHMQVEQFICLQRRSENIEMLGLNEVFKVIDQLPTATTSTEDPSLDCGLNLATTAAVGAGTEVGYGVASASSTDGNIFSPASVSSCSTSCGKAQPPVASPLPIAAADLQSSASTTVFKCNLCEYFVQSKKDIEGHIETLHPTAESDDYISIPTNTAALQAFQTAVAAAALAAVHRCNASGTPTSTTAGAEAEGRAGGDSDCPIDIKRERLEESDDPMTNSAADVRDNNNADLDLESNRNKSRLSPKTETETMPQSGVSCPLCLESGYSEKSSLEAHLMSVHNVTRDGLARLLQLVNHKAWRPLKTPEPATTSERVLQESKCNIVNAEDYASTSTSTPTTTTSSSSSTTATTTSSCSAGAMQGISCQQCDANFKHEEQLLQHAQQTQHYPVQNGEYHCLAVTHVSRPCFMTFASLPSMIAHFKDSHMSLVISERHVYKYRCKQCSLAFKTQEKLTAHMLYHSMRDATKCSLCQRNFRSTQALHKHMEQSHSAECTAVMGSSPRDLSPSFSSSEMVEKPSTETNVFDFSTARTNESVAKTTSKSVKQSPQRSRSPFQFETQSKDLPHQLSDQLSPNALDDPSTEQQHHFAALTAALLKQQQQQQQQQEADNQMAMSPGGMHQLQVKPLQQGPFGSISGNQQSFHGLQSIQNLQQIQQQLTAAAAASGMPINPVDMLNLMQFHHLMSLNFMNLAPPLIFGANSSSGTTAAAAAAAATGGIQNNGIAPATSMSGGGTTSVACLSERQQKCSGSASDNMMPQSNVTNNSQQQLSSNQKRARTRITDDQLKILRAHFDINNSPSEESIMEMSQKANLPMKVVKHWFRNTLFKERQRNKDSPYNFNNPPSTTLNLEEYERTGQTKVTPLPDPVAVPLPLPLPLPALPPTTTAAATATTNNQAAATAEAASASTNLSGNISDYFKTQADHLMRDSKPEPENLGVLSLPLEVQIKAEPQDDNSASDYSFHKNQRQLQQQQEQVFEFLKQQQQASETSDPVQPNPNEDLMHDTVSSMQATGSSMHHYQSQPQHQQHQQQHHQTNCFETKSESGSSDVLSRPPTPNSVAANNLYNSMNDLLSQQLENIGSNMGPPKKLQIAGKSFEKLSSAGSVSVSASLPSAAASSACAQLESNSSNSSNSSSSTSGGKRANRTRFTDYQIKVLQEFFENNSYPKDSDLEYLSKLLLLSPRVIVVWFQNARQKQRKIYENQPNNSLYESEETKKQNINYACKKCNLVFQRYYELIRHQKNHCFKEENNKKSAKAQIAAAQIAHNLSSEDSNSSMDIHHAAGGAAAGLGGLAPQNVAAAVAVAAAAAAAHSGNQPFGSSPSPQHLFSKASSLTDFSPSTTPTPPQRERSNSLDQQRLPKFECDKCEMQFNQLELLREHQLMHLMSPALFPASHHQSSNQSETAYGPFGTILQGLQQAAQQQQQQQQHQQQQQNQQPPPAKKRKCSESSSNADAEASSSMGEFETTQKKYEFLYQYFMQHETNPELKQQQFLIQQQQQQQQGNNESDLELEFLSNFYQQSELKKVSSYDFLLQYYRKNDEDSSKHQSSFSSSKKPTIEFLLQYYQLNESKKFFQLAASPQTTPDGIAAESQPSSHPPNATADETIKLIGGRQEERTQQQQQQQEQKVKLEHDLEYYTTTTTTGYENIKGDHSKNGLKPKNNDLRDDLHKKLNNNHIDMNVGLNEGQLAFDTKENKIEQQMENLQVVPSSFGSMDDAVVVNGAARERSPFRGGSSSSEIIRKASDNEKPQYFQNLEDFLDATMIENNSQMLTFNDDDDNLSPKVENVAAGAAAGAVKANDCLPLDSTVQLSAPSKQNKRLRTTILPDQLNFLYECYQTESNPSRKMLEEISKKVNLKKRVVQVWFQNSRAKDKKSRNQRQYAHISDDNNSFDGSSGKEAGNNSNSNNSKTQEALAAATSAAEADLQDCQLCQVPQVNMQKHAFSVEHICKMKELLEQTSELYAHSNASGSDDNDCRDDRERRFYSLSKAFLLQHMVSNAGSGSGSISMAPSAGTEPRLLATTTTATGPTAGSDDSGNNDPSAGARRHLAGDIAVSVNNDSDELPEPGRKSASSGGGGGSRELMQQLFNRNHITVIGGK
ncbi:zinc finger protein 2 isoform X2 [Drosophila montana]|uniref:zinc finger protein 2 isoform X2 n=1 Tax=Drosophila montana TaxID=40370 RepID=UPI00313ACD28